MSPAVIMALTVVSIFVLWLIVGMLSAAFAGRSKNRRAYAIGALSRLPRELIEKMVDIVSAHKNNDVRAVNRIVGTINLMALDKLLEALGPENRPKEFSAGKFGDALSWTVLEKALQKRGYTAHASKLVAGMTLNDIDDVLPVKGSANSAKQKSPGNELYLTKEEQRQRKIVFVHCEDEGCGFLVEFRHPNSTFFFCKEHGTGINLDLSAITAAEVKCELHGQMERYDIVKNDNVCPRCQKGLLAILSTGASEAT